jgi:quinol monooxygenase YgiN
MEGDVEIRNTHLERQATSDAETMSAVVELRRYRLRPGARERLIGLFDREFVETQEAVGMRVIGQFRDLDDPNAFVWLRGFRDMDARKEALAAFYGGPVWAQHRNTANDTMVNSDNVLLLRPAWPGAGFPLPGKARPAPDKAARTSGMVLATTCHLAPRTDIAFAEFFANQVKPALARASANVLAAFMSERSENTFPRLPVREGETVFTWFSSFADETAYAEHVAALARSEEWNRELLPEIDSRAWRSNDVMRLAPTARSLLPD